MRASMAVTFHGVRGSYPVSGDRFLAFGGNTSCVSIRAGGRLIVCDAGTGIIDLGNRLAGGAGPVPPRRAARGALRDREVILLFSHAHYDHVQGLPFFKPAYVPGFTLRILGPRLLGRPFDRVLARTVRAPFFPVELSEMSAGRTIRTVEGDEAVRLPGRNGAPAVTIRVSRNRSHPRGGVANFRVECGGRSVVYATDVEPAGASADRLARFASGATLLIHDAQYVPEEYDGAPGGPSTRGWGHSTYAMAARTAREAGARTLALFHHDPSHDDAVLREIERRARALAGSATPRVFAARQGQRVVL